MDQGRIVMDGAKEAILREQSEPTARRVVLQEKNRGLPHERTTAEQPWPE